MLKKIFYCFLIVCMSLPVSAKEFSLNDNYYYKEQNKNIIKDLSFTENEIFNKTYKKDDITTRLERLELAVYGALQSGEEIDRIKKLKNDVMNVSSGGKGLKYANKPFEITKKLSEFSNWSIGYNSYCPYYAKNNFRPVYSHRLPHLPKEFTHRLPPPPRPVYINCDPVSNPIINRDFNNDYSYGTSVHILRD